MQILFCFMRLLCTEVIHCHMHT